MKRIQIQAPGKYWDQVLKEIIEEYKPEAYQENMKYSSMVKIVKDNEIIEFYVDYELPWYCEMCRASFPYGEECECESSRREAEEDE